MIAAVESQLRAASCEPRANQKNGFLEACSSALEARLPPEPAPPPVKDPPPEGPENPDAPVRKPDPEDPFET